MSLDARKSLIAEFLVDNRMVADVYNGHVKTMKIVDLVLKLINYQPDERGPLSRHGRRDNIKRYLTAV
eukprot:3693825-Pyramimonas_sp.AAC.1